MNIITRLIEMQNLITEVLGFPGRMISGSKSGYRSKLPENVAIFNANLCTKEGKIWYGDIDLTISSSKLIYLCKELNSDLYVLYETDARFENEKNPLLNRAVAIFKPDGSIEIGKERERSFEVKDSCVKYKNLK